jgi:hypothetical protein
MSGPPVTSVPPVLKAFPSVSVLPGLDIKVVWRPRAQNFPPQTAASGREVIVGAGAYPIHEFDLIYNVLRSRTVTELEFRTLMGFWLNVNGRQYPFTFVNPWDSYATGSIIGPTVAGQTQYVITRDYGANGYIGTEPIGIIDQTATWNLYIDGIVKSPSDPTWGYSVDASTPWNQLIVFNSGTAAGHTISVDGGYMYYCRLGDDETEFEQVLYNVLQNRKLTIVTKKGG